METVSNMYFLDQIRKTINNLRLINSVINLSPNMTESDNETLISNCHAIDNALNVIYESNLDSIETLEEFFN